MDYSSEKHWPNETPSSSGAVLIHGPVYGQQSSERIRHHFMFSLFSVLCLCPATGLIALAYSIKSSAKADVNFHDKARLYSRRALFWNIMSIVFAILSTIAICFYFYQLNEILRRYTYTVNQQKQSNNANDLIRSIINN